MGCGRDAACAEAAAEELEGTTREVLLMKAAEMFNACHARYRGLHEWLDNSLGEVRALDLDSPSCGYQWRPERSRACEYVADFERIGRQALKRPAWKGRLKLFEIYFLGGADYRSAISLVGVAEGTFDYWLQEVKKAAGREFSRTGLYPPVRYFQSSHGRQPRARNL